MNMRFDIHAQRDAGSEVQVVPQDDAATHPEAYWCVVCGRAIAPETHDDGNLYIHDNIPHPDQMTFDEEERPQ